MLLAGHCSPVQLPACDQALGAPLAQWVPRAARSLRLWPRDRFTPDAPSVFPGLPCPFLQAVAQRLGPCSLLPLELCGPPGSVRAPVGAFATHTARFLGPALLPTLDARLAHGGCTAVLAPACPEPLGCAGQRWGPGSCQLKPDTHAAVFPGQACWRRISLGFCKLSFNVLKVSTHEV